MWWIWWIHNLIITSFINSLAYTSLNQLEKAKEAYAKAVDLEPSNDSYQANLQIAEQKLREANLGVSDETVLFYWSEVLWNPI